MASSAIANVQGNEGQKIPADDKEEVEAEATIEEGGELADPPEKENEVEAEPHVPPAEPIMKLLVAQAEFYFGDENINKDTFLLKHILKNKEGYVSLKLVASFRKIKKVSRDWRDLAYSVTKLSEKLELNPAGTKVRRKAPLPPHELLQPAGDVARRSVIATNLKLPAVTIEEVKQMFGVCGLVTQVHILTPGNVVPTNLQRFFKSRPEIYAQTCAFVEYQNAKQAQAALAHFSGSGDGDWRGMQVHAPALPVLTEDAKMKARLLRADRRSVSESDAIAAMTRRKNVLHDDRKDESSGSEYDSGVPIKGAKHRPQQLQRKSHSRPIPITNRLRNTVITPSSSPDVRRKQWEESPSSSTSSLCGSPWLAQRRMYTASESGSTGNLASVGVTVLREPLASDGTKGFLMKRSKHRI